MEIKQDYFPFASETRLATGYPSFVLLSGSACYTKGHQGHVGSQFVAWVSALKATTYTSKVSSNTVATVTLLPLYFSSRVLPFLIYLFALFFICNKSFVNFIRLNMFVFSLNGCIFLVNICLKKGIFVQVTYTKTWPGGSFSPGVEQVCLVIVHCSIQSVSVTLGNSTKAISTFYETLFCYGQHFQSTDLSLRSTANSCMIGICCLLLLEVIHTGYNLISHIVPCPKLPSRL